MHTHTSARASGVPAMLTLSLVGVWPCVWSCLAVQRCAIARRERKCAEQSASLVR